MAKGAGAQSRVPIGIVIVDGLTFSLVLTLLVIPVKYIIIGTDKNAQPNILIPKFKE